MELQLFDDAGTYYMRVNASEPLWQVLGDCLRETRVIGADGQLGGDVSIEPSELPAVLDHLGEILRERLSDIEPTDTAGHYDESTISVLGQPVTIRVRDPRHYALKRINSLYECLASIMESGQRVQLFAVPDLESIDYGIIGALEETSGGFGIGELTEQVVHRFAKLQQATEDPDVRDGLRRQADSVSEAAVAERVEYLTRWSLVEQRPGGVAASEKLRTILR